MLIAGNPHVWPGARGGQCWPRPRGIVNVQKKKYIYIYIYSHAWSVCQNRVTATSYWSLAGQRLPPASRGFQKVFKRFSKGFQKVFQEVFNRFSIGFQRTFTWTSDWAQVAWIYCMQGKTPLNTNQSIMGPVYGFFVSPALIFSPNIFASSCPNLWKLISQLPMLNQNQRWILQGVVMSYIWVTNMMHFLVLLHIHGVFIVVVLHKSLRVDEKELSSQNKIKSVSSLTIFAKPTIESVG